MTQDRWLTDSGLRDYLSQEVPRYLTREMQVRGTQTPQAIISGSGSFRIRYLPAPPKTPANAILSGIKLKNQSDYLEGTETGAIRTLEGFQRGYHKVPDRMSESADGWVHRLLSDRVSDELQQLYDHAKEALDARRRDMRKETDSGAGDLDTPVFRYSIETSQNPEDPSEYLIRRKLELRPGWGAKREAIEEIFGNEFDRIIIEFDTVDSTFDELVDKLENIKDERGGTIKDDDRTQRVSYTRDEATFTFDIARRRLEISFGRSGCLELVEAAQQFQLGLSGRVSPMLIRQQEHAESELTPSSERQPSIKQNSGRSKR